MSANGMVRPRAADKSLHPIRASSDLSCEVATCRGRSVDQRTDGFTSCDVAFFTMAKNKRPELDLITEAQAARVEARAMPQGPGRTAAMQKNRHSSRCCRLTRN